MLLANETVAEFIVESDGPDALPRPRGAGPAEGRAVRGVHRRRSATRSAPPPSAVRPRHFQQLLERIRGTPEERPIAFLMLRTMQKARYAPRRTSATSGWRPRTTRTSRRRSAAIRIWSCTACCASPARAAPTPTRREELDEDLPEIARHTSEHGAPRRRRRARAACSGRRSGSWPTRSATSSTATSPAWRRSASSSSWSSTSSKGSCTSRAWPTTTTASSKRPHTLRGENTHKVYRLGDRVRVQVVRVDMERRQIDLGLVEVLDALP